MLWEILRREHLFQMIVKLHEFIKSSLSLCPLEINLSNDQKETFHSIVYLSVSYPLIYKHISSRQLFQKVYLIFYSLS